MSLASIKEREAKGKKKCLPKLRTVLASPYKCHSPILAENEVSQFCQILKNAMQKSEGEAKTFATRNGIHLGLESSLRAINSKRFSCLLISLSLRPAHLIRLVATSASVKVPTAPIYAQPKLEDLTQEIFGIRAIAVTLPLNLRSISEELEQWIAARKRVPSALKITPPKAKKPKRQEPEVKPEVKESPKAKTEVKKAPPKQDWGDDFISCSGDQPSMRLDQVDVQVETQQLGAALSKLGMKAKRKATETKIVEQKQSSPELEPMKVMEVDADESEDDLDFLPKDLHIYRPLTVKQMQTKPNKKPKKKRNKSKHKPPPNNAN
ncbi:hypothetical protein KR018_011448 [Drosophila ironensis]|nr:hypothetical protein KR018_011448 [Drosophila ironensis]